MVRKLIRIGNSVGVTLDKRVLRRLGLDGVTWLSIEPDFKNKRLIIRRKRQNEW